MATHHGAVSGSVTIHAPHDQAARTTAHQVHLTGASGLDHGVGHDASDGTPRRRNAPPDA